MKRRSDILFYILVLTGFILAIGLLGKVMVVLSNNDECLTLVLSGVVMALLSMGAGVIIYDLYRLIVRGTKNG